MTSTTSNNSLPTVSVPREDVLTDILRTQWGKEASGKDEPLKLTADEAKKLQNAFADEGFRKLMTEYVSEISDPKHHAEQDEYIRQLEEQNAVPEGKQIIRPKPGFVLKFKHKKNRKGEKGKSIAAEASEEQSTKSKLFINIVYSEQIEKPTSEAIDGHQEKKNGRNWSLPYSLGPLRMEEDKEKSLVPTFDCCYHPEALKLAPHVPALKDLVAVTARDGVIQQFKSMNQEVEINPEYHILKGVRYRNGTPPIMVLATSSCNEKCKGSSKKDITSSSQSNDTAFHESKKKKMVEETEGTVSSHEVENAQQDKLGYGDENGKKEFGGGLNRGFLMKAKRTARRGKPLGCKPNKADPQDGSESKKGGVMIENEQVVPEYTVVEQGIFQISDHTLDGFEADSRKPKYLIYRIHLPRVKNASELNLDVSEEKLVLQSKENAETKYFLEVKLPYPVLCDDGEAGFDKTTTMLTVKIPVCKPPAPPPVNDGKSSKQSHEIGKEEEIDQGEEDDDDNSIICGREEVAVECTENKQAECSSPADYHSRWVGNGKERVISSKRESFAVEGILPTCNELLFEESHETGEVRSGVNEEIETLQREDSSRREPDSVFAISGSLQEEGRHIATPTVSETKAEKETFEGLGGNNDSKKCDFVEIDEDKFTAGEEKKDREETSDGLISAATKARVKTNMLSDAPLSKNELQKDQAVLAGRSPIDSSGKQDLQSKGDEDDRQETVTPLLFR